MSQAPFLLEPDETEQVGTSPRAAFEATREIDAQKAARAAQLSKELNQSENVVLEDLPTAESELRARQVEADPRLSGWAGARRTNAAFVRDDPALQTVFEATQGNAPFMLEPDEVPEGVVGYEPGFVDSLSEAMPGTVKSLAKQVARAPGTVAQMSYQALAFGAGSVDYLEDLTAQGLKFAGITGGERTGVFGWARDYFLGLARNIQSGYLDADILNLPEEKRGKLWEHPEYLLDPEYLTFQTGEAATSLAAMLGGAYATGGGNLTAATIGGLMEAGSFFDQLMADGVSQENALSAAASFGAVTGLLNKIGLDKMLDVVARGGVLRGIRNALVAGTVEGGTEYLENPAQAVIEGLAKQEAPEQIVQRFLASLKDVDVIPGAFLLGGAVNAATHRGRAAKAERFAERQVALHTLIEQTKTKQLSPEHMQSALESASPEMSRQVMLPADAMLTLYQSGTDLLTPLGFTEEEITRAAELGQDMPVSLARLHSNLDQAQTEAAARIMRGEPQAMSAEEAAFVDERIAADAQRLVAYYQANSAEVDKLAESKARLREETLKAVNAVPGLKAQYEGLDGNVESGVDTWLNLIEKYALRMGATGQSPVETFDRITFDALRAARRAHLSQEEVIGEDLAELGPDAASQPTPQTTAPAPIVHEGVETMDDLYALAEAALPDFQKSITAIGEATGGTAHFRPGNGLKRPERVQRKIEQDYPTEGPKRVLDVLGGTLLYENRAGVEAALPVIEQQIQAIGGSIVRIKNRFEKPSAGYKDYLLNIRMPNGMVTELLMTTKAMSDAKAGPGHGLYEAGQSLEGILTDKDVSEEQRSIARTMKLLLRRASENYYGSTGEGSNETASDSVIEDPLNSASVLLEELSSTSVYPKLVSLLGNIRQVLPSVASTNGTSSYSTNFSTNTVPPSGKSNTRQGVAYDSDNPAFSSAERTQSGGEGREAGISEPPLGEGSIAQNGGQNNRPGKIIGSETSILGKGTSEQARYEVWELDDVIPSHDPENGFARREDYPAAAQERPYHSDAGEQEKVRGNALSYQPAFVVNSDPTAGNGPPIVTREGIVLGGNSRTMTLQLVYADRPDSAAAYRQTLTDQAAGFGLDPAALEGMRRPILVRVVDERMTPEEMAVKSRLYNQTTTQKLQAKAEGVSRARMISPATLAALSADMADFDTLRQFLDSPRSKGFVGLLLQDGVIEQTEISSLTEKGGRLNDSGKKLVEDALRGMVVADYDVLEALPASVLNKLDRTIPALARLKARGEGWDMGHVLTAALRIVGKAAAEGRKVEGWLGQVDLLDTDPDKKRPAVQALALTFANATQKEAAARFEVMAGEAERQTKGQGALIARPENRPGPAFVKAFLQPLASVDGRTITGFDPRGDERHAALQWAYEHGGKGKTVSAALDRLQKIIGAKKSTPEQKAEAREMIRLLSEFSGAISMYPPKLGPYFRYQEGQELFQAAFHGTPHRFDRFNLDAIGTGEGNQAHGWGLYFAQEKGTSEKYKTGLGVNITLDGKAFYDGVRGRLESSTGNKFADDTLLAFNGNIDEAIAELQDDVDYGMPEAVDALEVLQGIKADGRLKVEERGRLFEVDIPENDVLLDEQKTLGEQPEKVQSALRALAQEHGLTLESQYPSIETTESGKTFWIKHPGGWEPAGAPRFRSRAKAEQWLRDNPDAFVVIQDGKRIYNELATRLGSDRAASLALNDLGVKGVTYDGAQDGRCFVVFDDKAINILQTYYQGQDDPRGSVQIYPEGYLINLFQGADLSTLLHETGHIFFEEMERVVRAGAADETMRRDYETMRAWLGAEPGQSLTEEMREKAARGFEAYLMEGKAPSVELESAFARFRKWLLTIYQSATRLNAPLTDEVRGVFDRLLSSEREIAATAARNELLDLTARELDALGITGPARATVAGLMTKGREEAADAMQKARDANRRDRLAKYAAEARAELQEQPVYRARSDMRKTPLDLEAARDLFGEETAAALLKKLPGALKKDGGADPEIFAVEHGFASAADMAAQISEAPPLGEAIRQSVAAKEAESDSAYEALEYLLGAKSVRLQREIIGRRAAELTGTPVVERAAIRRAAEQQLASMPMQKALRADWFTAAMRRAMREEKRAMATGDAQAFRRAWLKAELNMELAEQSRALRQMREKLETRAKRFIGMDKADADARFFVMLLASNHGLVPFNERLAEGKSIDNLNKLTADFADDGYSLFLTQQAASDRTPWREMTAGDFEGLAGDISQIITVERNRRQIMTAAGKIALEEAAGEIAEAVKASGLKKTTRMVADDNKFFEAIGALNLYLAKTEILCMKLDGKEDGPLWQLYKRVADAEDAAALRMRKEKEQGLDPLYERLKGLGLDKKIVIKSLGNEAITRENMLCVALNLGNEINTERLLTSGLADGSIFTQENMDEIISHMGRADWEFVQAAWDYLETFREEAFALEERTNGIRPKAVEARQITVRTAEGESLTLKGGYYPIAYNTRKGARAKSLDDKKLAEQIFANGFGASAQTLQGHLQARAAHGLGTPLLLKLCVLDDHVYNVTRDICMREAVMDAAKLIRHRTFREAVEDAAGVDAYNLFLPWLSDIARDRRFEGGQIESAIRWMRNNVTMMALGLKAGTGLLQATGLMASASRLGPKWVIRGMRSVYGQSIHANPFTAARRLMDAYADVAARSPFMATRLKNFQREVKDASRSVKRGSGPLAWAREHGFDLIGLAQMGVDLPTWTGAYEKALHENGGDENKAVAFADRTVRITQGSGKVSDLSAVQRGGELAKAVTTFYSWFNTMFNLASLTSAEVRQAVRAGDTSGAVSTAGAFLFWAWFGSQAMEIALDVLVRGRGPDDDDEWGKYLAGKFVGFWSGMVPLGRDAADALMRGQEKMDSFRILRGFNEFLRTISKSIDAVQGDKGAAEKAAVSLVRSIGYATGTPTEPAAQILKTVWDYMDGTTPEIEWRKLLLR